MQSRRKILAGISAIGGVSIAGYAFLTTTTENTNPETTTDTEQNTTTPTETIALNTSETTDNTGCTDTPLSYSPELLTSGTGEISESPELTCKIPVSATVIENGGNFFTFTVPTTSSSTVEITLEFEYTDIKTSEYAASDSYSEITRNYDFRVSDTRAFVDNKDVLAPEVTLLIPTSEQNIRLTRSEITDSECPTIINNVTTRVLETTEQE